MRVFGRASREARFRVRVSARQLERAFHRFRAAVAEKHAVESRPFGELARERRLIRIVKQIRDVRGAARFAADHANHARMRVAQRVHGNSGQKIEIFPPLQNRTIGSRARA